MKKGLFNDFLKLERDHETGERSWIELEKKHGPAVYPALIHMLTRKRLPAESARRHWWAILAHQREMEKALGRPVGLRSALCDYFIDVEPAVEDPMLVEGNLFRQKEQSALRDELTGLFNRRFFNSIMEKQVAESQRFDQPFSLLMVDVDNFKLYNDTMGHLAGDKALYGLGRLLVLTGRAVDYVVRFGGEEFAVLLPRCHKDQALAAAERHRQAVFDHHFPGQERLPGGNLTISVGAACFPVDALDGYDLMHRADMALYTAKRGGRNQVMASGPERRRNPRVAFSAGVDLREQGSDDPFQRGETLDISVGGLRVAARDEVRQGSPLELVLHARPMNLRVSLTGQAVHLFHLPANDYPYQLGIKIREDAARPLDDLVRSHLQTMH